MNSSASIFGCAPLVLKLPRTIYIFPRPFPFVPRPFSSESRPFLAVRGRFRFVRHRFRLDFGQSSTDFGRLSTDPVHFEVVRVRISLNLYIKAFLERSLPRGREGLHLFEGEVAIAARTPDIKTFVRRYVDFAGRVVKRPRCRRKSSW